MAKNAKTTNMSIRMEPALKEEVDHILGALGLSNSEAIRLFFKQIVFQKGLPFDVRIPQPETLEALKESRVGKGKRHKTTEELFSSWD